jgi:hypothetical protein
MDTNLIYNFVDIFTDYYNLFYSSKIFYSKNIKEDRLYYIIYNHNNNVFNELYSIYFNNEKYYEDNDIENFKRDIELYMIKHYNVCNNNSNSNCEELQTVYNKIKEMYNEEIDNFT